jgi:hypothetical protein
MKTLRLLRNIAALFIFGAALLVPRPTMANGCSIPCKLMPLQKCENLGFSGPPYHPYLGCFYRPGYNCLTSCL